MTIKKIALYLFLGLFALSFIVPPVNDFPVDQKQDVFIANAAPPEVQALASKACYDCHSNKTNYPWYAVGPVRWYLNSHIKGGLKRLNFNTLNSQSKEDVKFKLKESCEEMQSKHMPLKSYTWLHPEAKLTEKEIEILCNWFESI